MNPANYKLSKEVLQEMIDSEYKNEYHRYETFYDTDIKGLSPADLSQKWLDDLFVKLSEPLKKMQVEFLNNSAKNCYKEKHISDANTNFEQIALCKELERQKVFGGFEKMLVNHRDGGKT